MAHADFVALRVHTAFSLSEGAVKIGELVELCRQHAMPAVAITDSGNLFGAMEFSEACVKAGVQPIIGCALRVQREEPSGAPGRRPPPDVIVALAQNEVGYANLAKLVSRAFLGTEPGDVPQVTWSDLEALSDGVLAFTGWLDGPVGRPLVEGQTDAAERALVRLARTFPGRLYLEIQRHGLEAEARLEPALLDLAYRHDLPLVATNDVYFASADMFEAHDVLLCIAEGVTINEHGRRRLTSEHGFKSPAEMRALFADLPEAVENTVVVARRCAARVPRRDPILPTFPTSEGVSEAEELRRQAREGLERRLARHVFTPAMDEAARKAAARPYRERLEYELDVIIEMNFAGYFLIVADFIQWAKREGIPVGPGRGSGAGSVVAWALTITDLEPLRFGLLFERFLNPERVSMPDFDIDFCQDRRDEVIRYVQGKYGRDQVAQIITFGTLQARAVLRDVGRVLEMPYGQVDRLCKLVPHHPAHPLSLGQAIEGEPQLQAARAGDEPVRRLIDVALKLEGLYRHASTHAAGVVIADRPLDQLVPLYRDPRSDIPATQFSMKDVEKAGLVKFDFLGLKTLTVLDKAVGLLAGRGIELDLSAVPLDDPATFELLGRGETVGVFQLESAGMRDVLRQLQPDRFEDIIALVALYRPGPMNNIPRYIACKHGEEEPDYLHPGLEEVLEETFGVIIYQEQVMQIAQLLAGYSLGRADLLRRAMGKKIKAEMDAQRESFVEGAVARGVPRERSVHIFELVARFAGYGFNKSHAAAYALVAYQTAYLKANRPVEFFAASMSLELRNTDKLNAFRQELDRLGIPLLLPDINRSQVAFAVETDGEGRGAIRYALAAIKNVGAQAMEAVVREREAGEPFGNLFDFAERLDSRVINKRQLESLAKAGAFDSLNPNRAHVFGAVDRLVRHAQAARTARASSQATLFGDALPAAHEETPLSEAEDWPPTEHLKHEFEAIGFYLSAHPLSAYGRTLERLGVVASAALRALLREGGGPVFKLAGIVLAKRERAGTGGRRFAFVQMSDATGVFEVAVFAELLAANRELLEPGALLLVAADARFEDETVKLAARAIRALDEAAAEAGAGLRVYLADGGPLEGLRAALAGAETGRGQVALVVPIDDGREVEIALPSRYAVSAELRATIRAIPGVTEVHDI
ncbi:MAG: DNA polymerase III subunit alpha [Alphaproteobacteria bacterium]